VTSPTAVGKALGAAGAAGGAATLAGSLGEMLGSTALSSLAGAWPIGLTTLPAVLTSILQPMVDPNRAHFPSGYQMLPGFGGPHGTTGSRAVDPSTGAVLIYEGNGRYAWSPETLAGQRFTPEQFQQYNIDPTGALLQNPAYATAQQNISTRDVMAALGTPLSTDPKVLASGQVGPAPPPAPAPAPETRGGDYTPPSTQPTPPRYVPSPQHVQEYLQRYRQPFLDRIKAAHPDWNEGQIWAAYQQTPEYLQESSFSDLTAPQEHG